VAIGMTSSTLVGAGLSPACPRATDQNKPLGESRKQLQISGPGRGRLPGEERRGEVRRNAAGAVERGAARAEDDDVAAAAAAARRREGARVWRRRHMAAAAVAFSGRPSRRWGVDGPTEMPGGCQVPRCVGFGAPVSGWPVTAPTRTAAGARPGFPMRRRYSENVACARSNSKHGRAVRCAPLHETPRPSLPSTASPASHVTSWRRGSTDTAHRATWRIQIDAMMLMFMSEQEHKVWPFKFGLRLVATPSYA
jgi:hypothetical protein